MPEGNPKKLITFGHMCRKNNDRLINEFAFTKNKERHLTKQMDRWHYRFVSRRFANYFGDSKQPQKNGKGLLNMQLTSMG